MSETFKIQSFKIIPSCRSDRITNKILKCYVKHNENVFSPKLIQYDAATSPRNQMKLCENSTLTKTSKWMQCPKIETEFPGLTYIYPLNELVIVKQKDALHNLIGKTGICYTIFNNQAQKVFLAVQEKRCQKFDVKIFNYYGNEVIQVRRPYKLCLNKALVWAPPGNFVGSVNEVKRCGNAYLVKNKDGKVVLKIKAQGLFHFVYSILSGDEEIGMVKNNWGIAAMLGTNNFGISFPVDADVGDKAVLLGACFLIGCLKY